MKARRRIAFLKAQDYADFQTGLQQRFATGEMVFNALYAAKNPEQSPLSRQTAMSALCQKRTSLSQRVDAIGWGTVVEDGHKHIARF